MTLDEYADVALTAYVKCALWSSTDDEGRPMDDGYDVDDLADGALSSMRDDVVAFVSDNIGDLMGCWSPQQAGHDFWLTRNGHGAGFWARGQGERGERLTDAAHAYGASDLYVGADGKLYV